MEVTCPMGKQFRKCLRNVARRIFAHRLTHFVLHFRGRDSRVLQLLRCFVGRVCTATTTTRAVSDWLAGDVWALLGTLRVCSAAIGEHLGHLFCQCLQSALS